MVAEKTDDGYLQHLEEELRYLENQLARARRKEETWSARRAMLEDSVGRTLEELGKSQ